MDFFLLMCDVGSKEFVAVFANNESQLTFMLCLLLSVSC